MALEAPISMQAAEALALRYREDASNAGGRRAIGCLFLQPAILERGGGWPSGRSGKSA